MDLIAESKKNYLWRKIIWHTDPDEHPLGPLHSAEVYCCEETNGYAIWYVRRLPGAEDKGLKGMENADYLLKYYAKNARDEAIERAVLIANSHASTDRIIEALDKLAGGAQKI